MINPETPITVTVGDLMDMYAMTDQRDRGKLMDQLLEGAGLKNGEIDSP